MEIFGKHKWATWASNLGLISLMAVIGFLGVRFGWFDYDFQLSTFIGNFTRKKEVSVISDNTDVIPSDPILNRNIFDLPGIYWQE